MYCRIIVYSLFSAGIGGQIGLFMGCSLITLAEFLEYVCNVVTQKVMKGKHRQPDPSDGNDHAEIPETIKVKS